MNKRINKQKIKIEFDVEYEEVEWKGGWIPKTVYKYRDWSNKDHRKILELNQIWVPDSLDFNDPFDCNIPVAYDLLSSNDEIAAQFIRSMLPKKGYSGNVEEEVQKKLKEGRHKDKEFITAYKKSVHDSSRKMHGVFSVTPINNNILMWSHYGNNHKGFCVGFDSEKIFNYLGGGGNVNYSDKYPIISPVSSREQQYLEMVLTKSIHWAYEVEYRLTTFGKTNQVVEIPKDAISEVILGAKVSDQHISEIKDCIAKQLPHVSLFQCIPHENDFVLEIRKI